MLREPDWTKFPNFSRDEFACRCGRCKGEAAMDPGFMQALQDLRDQFGHPLVISSGFRCALHPIKTPEHRAGKAADILIHGAGAKKLRDLAGAFFPRIGEKQHGALDQRYIHLGGLTSGVPSPWTWTYR